MGQKQNIRQAEALEQRFDRVVERAGGCRAPEDPDRSPKDKKLKRNSDYLFEPERVILELKTLEQDLLEDPKFVGKFALMARRWYATGQRWRNPDGTFGSTAACQREFKLAIRKPVKGAIDSAAAQLKRTKERLGKTDWLGVLVLVNDGNRAIVPQGIREFAYQLITDKQNRSIDRLITANTSNVPLTSPSMPDGGYIWAVAYARDVDIDGDLLDRLHHEWALEMAGPNGRVRHGPRGPISGIHDLRMKWG